jgi:CRISPR type I-D-associated protein Csc3/Cas10d
MARPEGKQFPKKIEFHVSSEMWEEIQQYVASHTTDMADGSRRAWRLMLDMDKARTDPVGAWRAHQETREETIMAEGVIRSLVDAYTQFYRPRKQERHAVIKPLLIAIDAIDKAWPNIDRDDMLEMIGGELLPLVEESLADEQQRASLLEQIRLFAEIVVDRLFLGLCDGQRALLREQAPVLQRAAYTYYLSHAQAEGK